MKWRSRRACRIAETGWPLVLIAFIRLSLFAFLALPVFAYAASPSGSGASFTLTPSPADAAVAALPNAPAPQNTASLSGTVLGVKGAPLPGAQVTVVCQDPSVRQTVMADRNGFFTFPALPPGTYSVTVTAPGMQPFNAAQVSLQPGQSRQLPVVAGHPQVSSTVHVTATLTQVAKAQVKEAEKQRVLAIIPNFYTSYSWNAVPMTPRLKFQMAFRSLIDPFALMTTAGLAGVEQWHDTFPGYGKGPEGYAKRFGAAYADTVDSRIVGDALLPSVFHQDPRYFYHGSGSFTSRLVYSLRESVMCRGDNGRQQVNFSRILGNFIAAGVSNLYLAPQDRQAGLTLRNGVIITASGAASNVLREFLSRPLTTHVPAYATGKPLGRP